MSPVWFGVLVIAYAVLDLAWVRWHAAVEARRPHRAGFWAIILLAISLGGGVAVYQHHWSYAIAMLLGSYLGTWYAVRAKRREDQAALGHPPAPSLLIRLLDWARQLGTHTPACLKRGVGWCTCGELSWPSPPEPSDPPKPQKKDSP